MVSLLLMTESVYVNSLLYTQVRVVFLLYHMNRMPKTTKHTPVITNNAKISLGDKEKG